MLVSGRVRELLPHEDPRIGLQKGQSTGGEYPTKTWFLKSEIADTSTKIRFVFQFVSLSAAK